MITGAGLAAGATLGLAAPAAAAPMHLTVDSLGDPTGPGACDNGTPDDCSLRQAVTIANDNAGEIDFIEFQAGMTGTLTLTAAAGGPISIVDPVYIYGNGPDKTTIRAASAPFPASEIFHVDLDTEDQDVGLYSMTMTGAQGVAIWNWDADLHVNNSVLTGNDATVVYDRGYGGDSTFAYSTFSGNNGRAIGAPEGFGAIVASTITDNTAQTYPAVSVNSYPGGVIYDSTISGNHADDGGSATGAVHMPYAILINTVVANTTGPNVRDVDAFYTYAATSLIETGFIDQLYGSGNIMGQDPQLGPLGMNGGDTPTMRPAASSPVVDAGFSEAQFDQRGSARIVDNPSAPNAPGSNGADIGALELTLAEGPQGAPAAPPPKKRKKCKKRKHKKHKKHSVASKKKKKRCKKKRRKHRPALARAHSSSAAPGWPERARPFRIRG